VITWFILRKMVFGRHAIAVGGNKNAAIASGIRANRVIRLVYTLDGITCAIAAIIFMSRLGAGQPNPGSGYAFDAITGVVVGGASLSGGTGGAAGTFVGVMIVGILNNIMNLLGMSSYYQLIVKGFLIVVAVVVDMLTKEALVKSSAK
jgi:inositol transport system permease protein